MNEEQDFFNNFLGKPMKIPLKANGKSYDFEFEQLGVDDLPEVIEILNEVKRCEIKNKKVDFKELDKKIIPLIRKMMRLSYPDGFKGWDENKREKFIKFNYLLLRDIFILNHAKTLIEPLYRDKTSEDFEEFIEEERKKISKMKQDGKCTDSGGTKA